VVATTSAAPSHHHHHHNRNRRAPLPTPPKSNNNNNGYGYDRTTSSLDEAARESSDATAALLEGAIKLALRARLSSLGGVDARVLSDARALLKGKFGGLRVTGLGWRTPLSLTARRLEVEVGEVRVDLADLVWRRRLQLRNTPVGRTSFLLTPSDLGRFTQHPVFLKAAARCVEGAAFEFEPGSVKILGMEEEEQGGGGGGGGGGGAGGLPAAGKVMMEGRWVGDGERYRVVMVPRTAASGGVSQQQQQSPPPQLQVGAQHLPRPGSAPNAAGAAAVARGLAAFFTSLEIDLQGVELERPVLAVVPSASDLAREAWHGHEEGGEKTEAEGEASGGSGPGGALLEIGMAVRIREFPPLDLQF
jgi:hypothetical protein